MHFQQNNQEAAYESKGNTGAREGTQLRKVGGVHKRNIFGERTHAVIRSELQNLRARGLGVAFASNVKHGHAFLRAADLLGGPQRNKKTRAFAMSDDAANGEIMIQQADLRANLEMTCLRNDVVRNDLIGALEWPAGAKKKAAAQGIKSFEV